LGKERGTKSPSKRIEEKEGGCFAYREGGGGNPMCSPGAEKREKKKAPSFRRPVASSREGGRGRVCCLSGR